jgi:hypothetical protein
LIHALFAGLLLVASAFFALLEIQIEGHSGWASSLPTWRIENRWTRAWLGNRALTGYHFYFHLFMFAVLHAVYVVAPQSFSLATELRILSFLILFWVVEDYLWFVFNPAYGMGGFTRDRVWWHAATWWGIMPRDYWLFIPAGVLLYIFSWRL